MVLTDVKDSEERFTTLTEQGNFGLGANNKNEEDQKQIRERLEKDSKRN